MKINESQLRLTIRKALLISEIGSVAAEDNYGDLNLRGDGENLESLGSLENLPKSSTNFDDIDDSPFSGNFKGVVSDIVNKLKEKG